jgi:hypothetical protein
MIDVTSFSGRFELVGVSHQNSQPFRNSNQPKSAIKLKIFKPLFIQKNYNVKISLSNY